jgi:hypothetical protein
MCIVSLGEFWKDGFARKYKGRCSPEAGTVFFKAKLEILLPTDLYYTDLPVPFIAVIFF